MDMQQNQNQWLFSCHYFYKQCLKVKTDNFFLPLGPGSGMGRCTCHTI